MLGVRRADPSAVERQGCDGVSMRMLDVPSKERMNTYARTHRLVVRVDGVAHEIIKLNGTSLSVTFACEPRFAVLVDPDTVVYEHGEIDISCMSCLVQRAYL